MRHVRIILFAAVALAAAAPAAPQDKVEKLDLKELLKRHALYLRKTETPELKSRAVDGAVHLRVLVGGQASLDGTASIVSEGEKRHVGMKFGHGAYNEENIVCDGGKISVGLINASRRSDLGHFLFTQDQVCKEGLFGGVLSSAWPLAAGAEGKGKLKYEGLKDVDGKKLHMIRYRTARKGGDLDITMYFDPHIYSHVRTVYQQTMRAGIASTPGVTETTPTPDSSRTESGETLSARQQTHRVRLEEEFDDFRNSGGYAVPAKWRIRLTLETQQSRVWEWVVNVSRVKNNEPVEAKTLEVK